ncbi:MAG: hypothetical protein KDK37_19225, partial [Leptospiraceae bacterium]|nr:hypothetical protein [Leptospiraceae bacterium]
SLATLVPASDSRDDVSLQGREPEDIAGRAVIVAESVDSHGVKSAIDFPAAEYPAAAKHFSQKRKELGLSLEQIVERIGSGGQEKNLRRLLLFEKDGYIGPRLIRKLYYALPEVPELATLIQSQIEDERESRRLVKEESARKSRARIALLFKYMDVIRSQRNRILRNPGLAYAASSETFTSFAYVAGSGPLGLGHLCLIWERNIMATFCPECEGKMLLLYAGGSILTGNHRLHSLCEDCGHSMLWEKRELAGFARSIYLPICEVREEVQDLCDGSRKDAMPLNAALRTLTEDCPVSIPADTSDLEEPGEDLDGFDFGGGMTINGKRIILE